MASIPPPSPVMFPPGSGEEWALGDAKFATALCRTLNDARAEYAAYAPDRLKLVAKLPMLCQRCHIGTRHPSTIYDGAQLNARSNRLIGRGCVNCHAQIHGSNSPAGNAFLR